MINMYVELTDKFPFIIALIDPLRKEVRYHSAVLGKLLILFSGKSLNFSHVYRKENTKLLLLESLA